MSPRGQNFPLLMTTGVGHQLGLPKLALLMGWVSQNVLSSYLIIPRWIPLAFSPPFSTLNQGAPLPSGFCLALINGEGGRRFEEGRRVRSAFLFPHFLSAGSEGLAASIVKDRCSCHMASPGLAHCSSLDPTRPVSSHCDQPQRAAWLGQFPTLCLSSPSQLFS